jgi:hypothetical protein
VSIVKSRGSVAEDVQSAAVFLFGVCNLIRFEIGGPQLLRGLSEFMILGEWTDEALQEAVRNSRPDAAHPSLPDDIFYHCWWVEDQQSAITPKSLVSAWRLFSAEVARSSLRPYRSSFERGWALVRWSSVVDTTLDTASTSSPCPHRPRTPW